MLRVLLSKPPRLSFGGVPLRITLTASSSLRRFSVFASMRALVTGTAPFSPVTSAVVPQNAADLRLLDVLGVVDYVSKELKIERDDYEKLVKQKVNGAALLETSVDELRSYGMSGGAAHTIMRAVADAQSATLTIFQPMDKKKNNPFKMTLAPDLFQRTFSPQAPLRLMSSSGSLVRIVTSLAEAAEASQKKGMFLHASRSYDEDLVSFDGFITNSATALEIKSTLALAGNEHLHAVYGELELVNEGQVVELKLLREGNETLKLAPDGLVVSDKASIVLFNSAKHTPSEAHLVKVLENVTTLEAMLADWANVTTDPPEAKMQLRGGLLVVPFLSGYNFNAAVTAECLKQGIGIVRPSGEGFIVKPALSGGL